MSFAKETGSCAPDNVLDRLTANAVAANPHIIEVPTDRLVKVPPFF